MDGLESLYLVISNIGTAVLSVGVVATFLRRKYINLIKSIVCVVAKVSEALADGKLSPEEVQILVEELKKVKVAFSK